MGRAILAISGSAASLLPRPAALISPALAAFAPCTALWRDLARDLFASYRPERHYMRGPGPAWRAKYGHLQQPAE